MRRVTGCPDAGVHGTGPRCTGLHRFQAASIFYPNLYPNRPRGRTDWLYLLVTAANRSDPPTFVSSLPSWSYGFDVARSQIYPQVNRRAPAPSPMIAVEYVLPLMPHPYAVRSQLSWRKPGTACSLDRGQAANYLISRVNEGVYRINLADRSDYVLLLSWVSEIQGPQNEQHSPLPEHLGT